MGVFSQFKEIWLVDFEFRAEDGNKPHVVCMVAKEFRTHRIIRLWEDELYKLPEAPFDVGDNALFVAYYASDGFGCFLALKWKLPSNVLDLFIEFRKTTNGLFLMDGKSILEALEHFDIHNSVTFDKDQMHDLIRFQTSYTGKEKVSILDHCESDVTALANLLPEMADEVNEHSLHRGRYMKAAAHMEFTGIPIDVEILTKLRANWVPIRKALIEAIDKDYDVYEGASFKAKRFRAYLKCENIPWPIHESGLLALDMDTFKDMARSYPQLRALKELRASLSKLTLTNLQVGSDGRNRCLLSAFSATTGRNQPPTSEFVFGPAKWIRHLIKPSFGQAVACLDWCQQEFAVAAALSGDQAMQHTYNSSDPYLDFAHKAGAVPLNATKASHPDERERFKQTAIGTLYNMGSETLARHLGIIRIEAEGLLKLHKNIYSKFWEFSESALDHGLLNKKIHTVFGWELHVTSETKANSIRNFPMQANGAEMLRLACCLATEQGIKVCAPIHDALLIEAPIELIEEQTKKTQQCMAEASEIVLGGFSLRSEAKITKYPERFTTEHGLPTWKMVTKFLKSLNKKKP